MRPGPVFAAVQIDTIVEVCAPPRRAVHILTDIILTQKWKTSADAPEIADEWLSGFLSALKRRETQAHSMGSYLPFAFSSADDDYIQGSSFVEPHDDGQTVEAKRRRANTLPIASSFEALTPTEFEVLCGGVLRFFGVSCPVISRRSADQGIDFYGHAPFTKVLAPERLPAGVERGLRVWIVGQAKHYSSVKVSTKELRELVGSAELARSKTFVGSVDPLGELSTRICDPIFYMIVTSGRFTSDSRELVDRSGIIAMDQMQLAQLLADNGIGATAAKITKEELFSWLEHEPAPSIAGST